LEILNSLIDGYYLPKEKAWFSANYKKSENAITALRTAIAEAEKQESAMTVRIWRDENHDQNAEFRFRGEEHMNKDEALDLAEAALLWANHEINGWKDDAYGYDPEDHPEIMAAIAAINQARSAPVREPKQMNGKQPPASWNTPAAQRQPLTDGEMHTAYITATDQTLRPQDVRLAFAFARAIEAAHGIGGKA
jgi:hypothetical protein